MDTGGSVDVVVAAVVVVVWPAGGVDEGVELPHAAAVTDRPAVSTRADVRVQRICRGPFVVAKPQNYPVGPPSWRQTTTGNRL
jgi:hypothetical protein